jgi:MFS family permease
LIQNVTHLLRARRFLPLFGTQFLGAFNDSLFKQAVVLFVTYQLFSSPAKEFQFSAIAQGLFILPFFIFSALAGQLADDHDKARLIRIIKLAEIGIMILGGAGIMLANIPLMLVAVALMGVHSTFFGPIKYAILPQHLRSDEVLGGTGLVEAATYLAILMGTIMAAVLSVHAAAIAVLVVAFVGWVLALFVPPAPRAGARLEVNFNPITSSWRLISATMHIPRLFLAICAISFFWTMGAVLIVIFPPLVKNVLTADKFVSGMVIALFSIGVAVGSVVINVLLKGKTSARLAPFSVLAMGGFVIAFSLLARAWPAAPANTLYDWITFIEIPRASLIVLALMGIAVTGGMFVVPLYAFLTTTVTKDQTARTVAANNVVNSGAMVVGALGVQGLSALGVTPENMLFVVAAMCPISAWIAQKLHLACD